MNETVFTVPMALTDFIPVFLFGFSAVLLIRDLRSKMAAGVFACLNLGVCLGFLAGFLKALYKLLIAVGAGEFPLLNTLFLQLQSLGLLLTGLSIVLMLALRRKAALAMAPLTLGYISMMVIGLGAMCAGLSVLGGKRKRKGLIAVFLLCFFCYMAMGYLASREGNTAAMNWIEQGVNCLGQLFLLWGVLRLHKAGLRDFTL